MSRQQDVYSFGCTRVVVGLSAIVEINISKVPCCVSTLCKKLSGGTLEIVSGVSLLSNAASHRGTGYPLGETEVFAAGGAAVFHILATGSTSVLAMINGLNTKVET